MVGDSGEKRVSAGFARGHGVHLGVTSEVTTTTEVQLLLC